MAFAERPVIKLWISSQLCSVVRIGQWLLAPTDDDVVDGDEDNLHEVADEAHHREAKRARRRNLLELLRIRLRATSDQSPGVLREVVEAHDDHANWIVLVLEELREPSWAGRLLLSTHFSDAMLP